MSSMNRLFLFFVTILACMGFDQATKVMATTFLKNESASVFWGNFFRLEYAENRGAFLSLGANLSDEHRWLLLTVLASVVLVALGVFVCLHKAMRVWEVVGYSLILAGGVSNMLDRITAGYVVDFMNMGIGGLRTGIFNVADIAIMAGLFVVVATHIQNVKAAHAKNQIQPSSA